MRVYRNPDANKMLTEKKFVTLVDCHFADVIACFEFVSRCQLFRVSNLYQIFIRLVVIAGFRIRAMLLFLSLSDHVIVTK